MGRGRAVKPVLQSIGYLKKLKESSALPRLWWVGTGVLGNFLCHAAGDYKSRFSTSTEAAINYYVSSYTPTVKALLFSRQLQSAYQPPLYSIKLLAIAMPETPGFAPLQGAIDEVRDLV